MIGKLGLGIMAASMMSSEARLQNQIVISTPHGELNAELADNAASVALIRMLPLTINMRDHPRQEKTVALPARLPNIARQREFSIGTMGLWGPDDFVIYYQAGQVPSPGIAILGRVTGDVSILDQPDPVTVTVRRAQ